MPKPSIDSLAPDFTAPVVGGDYEPGSRLTLSALRGQPVVLYFYPKDDTPGCTTQACAIRDSWNTMSKKARLFGVSVDPVKNHIKFQAKYDLPFPLISDEDQSIVNAYGVWVEKMLYGKKYLGTERSTFVIGADGRILAILEKVKPDEHVDLLIEALEACAPS